MDGIMDAIQGLVDSIIAAFTRFLEMLTDLFNGISLDV